MSMKTVVVTGASTGIGYATCARFITAGFRVFGSVRTESDALRLQQHFGPLFQALQMDVTNSDEIDRAVMIVREQLVGVRLHALINNAGIAVVGPMEHMSLTEVRKQFEVNFFGLVDVTKKFLPLLGTDAKLIGEPGKIINISSVAGKKGSPFSSAYAASKHALEGWSECVRQELMIYGIDVIIIGPGVIETPIWQKNTDQNLERFSGTVYWPAIQEMLGITEQYVKRGYKAVQVANVIEHVINRKRPKVRYPVMANKWLNWYALRFVPSRLMDWMIAKRLKLLRKNKR